MYSASPMPDSGQGTFTELPAKIFSGLIYLNSDYLLSYSLTLTTRLHGPERASRIKGSTFIPVYGHIEDWGVIIECPLRAVPWFRKCSLYFSFWIVGLWLPWWTSLILKFSIQNSVKYIAAYQSRMRILRIRVSCWTTRAATATLLKKQNPIWLSGSAWCPGGRTMAKLFFSSPRATARQASTTPPQLRRAARVVLGIT